MRNRTRTRTRPYRKFANRRLLLAIGAIILALCLLSSIWYFTRNTSLSRQDRGKLHSKLESIHQSINLPGELVYSQLQDSGCTENVTGLQSSFACGFSGFKLYKNTRSLTEDLQAARNKAVDLGFKEFLEGKRYLDGKGIGEQGEVILDLHSHSTGAANTDYTIKQLIDEGKLKPPDDNEYIYGFRIGAIYYSCTEGSLFRQFKQPCPNPPSSPH
jgi:hypothetical protein